MNGTDDGWAQEFNAGFLDRFKEPVEVSNVVVNQSFSFSFFHFDLAPKEVKALVEKGLTLGYTIDRMGTYTASGPRFWLLFEPKPAMVET